MLTIYHPVAFVLGMTLLFGRPAFVCTRKEFLELNSTTAEKVVSLVATVLGRLGSAYLIYVGVSP